MDMTLRPATPTEWLYACKQHSRISELCGNPGCLWGELDNTGTVFLNHWDTYVHAQHTPEFKSEFNTVLDMLRFDERYGFVMQNRSTMVAYCLDHPESHFGTGCEYAFRADTKDYSFLLRCSPDDKEIHAHVYAYRRDLLKAHEAG